MIQARILKRGGGLTLDVQFRSAAHVTMLFGPPGAGKTLVLEAIAGFVRPDEGRILLDDEILYDGATGVHLPPQKRHCGHLLPLFPHMTLRQNLEFAAERRPRLERHRRVNEMLERFGLAEAAARKPHELSRLERQRGSIARAMIVSPKLMLIDEPAAELHATLRQVSAPLLIATGDLDLCMDLGEEMLVLREGKVVQSGTPRKVLEQPASLDVARLFGPPNLLPVEIRALDPARNSSRLRWHDFTVDIDGPYFPGRLLGDRVWLCVSPRDLVAAPRNGKPGPNQVPLELRRVVEKAQLVRLEFSGDVAVELSRADYEKQKQNKEWVVEFRVAGMRVI